ncbi:MAG: DUF4465 domain-containing protein [Alistipes sp.]|nr:DUF4465 domain-containing protein [Alistipes sp.]
MRKLMFALAILGAVACEREAADVQSVPTVEKFDAAMTADYSYGYQNDHLEFEYFYNEEYAYWGGFAQSRVKDADAANGLFANQYAVYNEAAASGDSFLIYYYDSYNEPCDIVVKQQGVSLRDVMLNLTTYTYASITNEAINDFARIFVDGDYLKVVFTGMRGNEATGVVECYVVDYRDGKRAMTTEWTTFSLANIGEGYDRVSVTIETTDVGEWGANTPLYIAMDNLSYSVL